RYISAARSLQPVRAATCAAVFVGHSSLATSARIEPNDCSSSRTSVRALCVATAKASADTRDMTQRPHPKTQNRPRCSRPAQSSNFLTMRNCPLRNLRPNRGCSQSRELYVCRKRDNLLQILPLQSCGYLGEQNAAALP